MNSKLIENRRNFTLKLTEPTPIYLRSTSKDILLNNVILPIPINTIPKIAPQSIHALILLHPAKPFSQLSEQQRLWAVDGYDHYPVTLLRTFNPPVACPLAHAPHVIGNVPEDMIPKLL